MNSETFNNINQDNQDNKRVNQCVGKFDLYIGCMFASKSTELIKQINRYKSIGKKVLKINNTINNRYDTDNISTHDGAILDNCIITNSLMNVASDIKKYDVIAIEEIQFFSDAREFIITCVDDYKKVVIAVGLDGDFKRQPFPVVSSIIPLADSLIKLKAYCAVCKDGTPAIFSKLINNPPDSDSNSESNGFIIGSTEKYIAVCRKHFFN